MAFLFGRNRQRSNSELCRSTKELLQRLNAEDVPSPRTQEQLAQNLSLMKVTLQGTTEVEANAQQVFQLVHLLQREDVLYPLAKNIRKLPFESRKDAQVIFSSLFRFKPEQPAALKQQPQRPDEPPVVSYVVDERPDVLISLCTGYDHKEGSMQCGGILREALKHDSVAAVILYDEPQPSGRSRGLAGVNPNVPASGQGVFWRFFDWIDRSSFEISTDAFNTFKEILTRHKKMVSHFLLTNYDLFIPRFNTVLLQSQSYVTKRQSLQLFSTLLLERSNYALMTRYVSSGDNLKLAMNLLRDDRRMVNYEGFHVFKVFVANPSKSYAVQKILINNKDKLLRFLPGFLEDRAEDVQFNDEKAYLIKMIEQLPSQPTAPPPGEDGSPVQGQGPQQGQSGQQGQRQQTGANSGVIAT